MRNTLKTSLALVEAQRKDRHFAAQKKRVFEAFERQPATMLMVSIETGILRANICRYVAEWRKHGHIHVLNQGLCKVSKHRAGYYTTNTSLFTQPAKLF
jgi:hypothetical protein